MSGIVVITSRDAAAFGQRCAVSSLVATERNVSAIAFITAYKILAIVE